MRKLFKTAILGVSALALPFALAATVNASAPVSLAQTIDTRLEYQVNAAGDSMRFISTMELNGASLDNITNIELNFDLSKEGETTKHSNTVTQTTVYDRITGDNGKDQVDDTYYAVFKITDLTKNYTGWSITPYFKYNYSDNSTETVTASSWIIGLARVYFIKDSSGWGNDINVYMFENNEHHNATWPGARMTYDETTNMYYYDYALGERFNTVIFNDGSNQTGNEAMSSDNIYYVQNGDEALPHPTASHSIVHDNNKHYCEYCHFVAGNHNLTATIDEQTGMKHITCSDCDFVANLDPNIFYFSAPVLWENVNVYMWNDNGDNGWPGVQAQYVGLNEFNQKIYSIDTTGFTSMIFNNGQGSQTADIIKADCGAYNGLYRNDDGSVGYYVYVPENHHE